MFLLVYIKKPQKTFSVMLFNTFEACLTACDKLLRGKTGLPFVVLSNYKPIVNYKYFADVYHKPAILDEVDKILNDTQGEASDK